MAIMMEAIMGSRAYGLNHAQSDKDFLAIEVFPTDRFLGLFDPRANELIQVWKDDEGNDHTSHELRKALGLMMASKPQLLELLYRDEYTILTDEGRDLLSMRDRFLSTRLSNAYRGHMNKQQSMFLAHKDQDRKLKSVRHFKRLSISARHAWLNSHIKTMLDSSERDETLEFSYAALDNSELLDQEFEDLNQFFKNTPTSLPFEEDMDFSFLEEFILRIRRNHL